MPSATDTAGPEAVLSFWFGELDAQGFGDEVHSSRWWSKDPGFDQELRERFGALHAAIARGERDAWLASVPGRLAYIVVLDQFSRNMFRGTGDMFAQDARALRATLEGLDLGVDRPLRHAERQFFYMPLMHSEDLAIQERCVQVFTDWRDEATGEVRSSLEGTLDYAVRHRDIVQRFGRFPHRNALLGRPSTSEEVEFLKQPGSSF
jgi:uncharacterized protein (DUF924 family)